MQLFARLKGKSHFSALDEEIFLSGHPKPGDVIEFYGREGTGKTQVLLNMIAKCILPSEWKDLTLGGMGIGVVFIDTDFHFSILRLFTILERKIIDAMERNKRQESADESSLESPTESEVENFLQECLKRVYVVRCNNSTQLVLTLHSLETLFSNKPYMSILMIDSIAAFYWIDKMNGGDAYAVQEANQKMTVEILGKLISTYNLVLIATKPSIFQKRQKMQDHEECSSSSSMASKNMEQIPEHCEYLCRAWQAMVTYRFIFAKEPLTQLPLNQKHIQVYSISQVDKNVQKFTKFFHIVDSGIKFVKN